LVRRAQRMKRKSERGRGVHALGGGGGGVK